MKFTGKVGYGVATEKSPGVFTEDIVEVPYRGDVLQAPRQVTLGDSVNPDLSLNTSISIVADAFANEHFFAIRYVLWQGSYWSVPSVTPVRPRLIIQLGGVYNGEKAPVSDGP